MSEFFRARYLIVVGLLTGLNTVAAVLGAPTWATIPLGAFVFLFAPGYALLAAAFGPGGTRWPQSVVFVSMVGLSAVANILIGLLALVTASGLPDDFFAVFDLGIVVICAEVLVGRGGFPTSGQSLGPPSGSVPTGRGGWRNFISLPEFTRGQKIAAATLVVAAIAVFGWTVSVSLQHPHEVPTVSLGITGPGGNSTTLPRIGTVGQSLTVLISASSNASYPHLVFLTQAYLSPGPPPSQFTSVPWNSTLSLGPGVQSSTTLSFPTSSIQTFDVSFTFAQRGSYVVSFSLETSPGTPLRTVLLNLTIQ
jgi:hypothetical protein